MRSNGGSAPEPARGLTSRLRAAFGSGGAAGMAGAAPHAARAESASAAYRGAGPRAGSENGGYAQQADRTDASGFTGSQRGADQSPGSRVPPLLKTTAAWCWRLLLVAAVAYLAFRVAVALRLVVIPLIAALLATALLQPFTALLRRAGRLPWPRPGARCWPPLLCSAVSER